MKPYASYKPSGVPWLGDIPGHWRVMPIRYLSRGVKTGGTPPQESFVDELSEGAIPWYAPADLRNFYVTDSSRIVAAEFSSEVDVFSVGTIALVGIGDVGRVAMLSVEGTGNQQLNFIRPVESVLPKYLTYAFMAGQDFVRSRANVTLIPILNQESTKRLQFVIPDFDEQQAIADYLDVETARIDTLIHEKDELIGLLREWRQSVIAEAVTKGLDKSAATKPSGVPWLGDVPSHWDVVPLRYLSRGVKTGGTPAQEAFVDEQSEGVIPWYAPADLRDFFLTESSRIVAAEYRSEVDVFAPGTIALVGIGDVGRVAMLTEEGTGNQQLNFIRPVAGIVSKFLTYALMAAQEFVRSRANVTLIPILNQENTKRLRFAIPPFDEQKAIADYLDAETSKIDDLIVHTNDEITLLKELRAATIADAVLGRIDVRTIPLACRDTP